MVCFLNRCKRKTINLYHVSTNGTELLVELPKTQLGPFCKLAKKYQMKVVSFEKRGLPFFFMGWKKYILPILGIMLSLIFLLYQKNAVWMVQIEGVQSVSEEEILIVLEQTGVYPGCQKSQLSLPELEKRLRECFPILQWVSCTMDGTVLLVSCTEGRVLPFAAMEGEQLDLVASHNGYVESIVVRKGTAMVKPGDYVTTGQILIAGKIHPVTSEEFEEKDETADGVIVLKEIISEMDTVSLYKSDWVKPAWWDGDDWIQEKKKKSQIALETECLQKINTIIDRYRKKGIQILEKNVNILRTVDSYELRLELSVLERIDPADENG